MSIKDILARHHLLDHVVLSRPIDVLLSALEPTVPPAEPDPHGIIEGDVNLVDDLSKSPIPGFDFALINYLVVISNRLYVSCCALSV